MKLSHRLILYSIVFIVSFFVGLTIKNHFSQKEFSLDIERVNQKQNNISKLNYLALDPIIPEKGYINLTKEGYYFRFNFTYYSNNRYCINGTIFSIRGGTYKVSGCSWEGKLNVEHLEREIKAFGMNTLLQTVIDLIFFPNKLLANNRIKLNKNYSYSGEFEGTFIEKNDCYEINLHKEGINYTKYFCPIQQSAKSS